MRSILRGLGADPIILNSVAKKITAGELEFDVVSEHANSTLGYMSEMRRNLLERNKRAAQNRERIDRLRDGLDKLTAPVLVSGVDGATRFINKSFLSLISDEIDSFRQICPKLDPNDLSSFSLLDFSQDKNSVDNAIKTNDACFEYDLKISGKTFQCFVNQTVDDAGSKVGYTLEMHDVSTARQVLYEVDKAVTAANHGELDVRISSGSGSGDYHRLADGVNELLDLTQTVSTELTQYLRSMSSGDLAAAINAEMRGEFSQIKRDANQTSKKLSDVMQVIRRVALNVDSASKEISEGAMDLQNRTSIAAGRLEETHSNMIEMTAAVERTATSAERANELAQIASQNAKAGGEVVNQAVDAMSGINESSRKINDITSVIDDIAFQTNLLALNASVEAARAGEQGRGFAVVASEVRNLAGRSAEAAKEIKTLIDNSAARVERGSELVTRSGQRLGEILGQIAEVADIVREISTSGRELSESIQAVNSAVSELDQSTQQNASLVEETSAASRSTSDQASELLEHIQFFSREGSRSDRPPIALVS